MLWQKNIHLGYGCLDSDIAALWMVTNISEEFRASPIAAVLHM